MPVGQRATVNSLRHSIHLAFQMEFWCQSHLGSYHILNFPLSKHTHKNVWGYDYYDLYLVMEMRDREYLRVHQH